MRRLFAALLVLCLNASVIAQDGGSTPSVRFAASNPFGVIEGFWLPDDVCAMGAGWERIIFDWGQHQPEGPESWNTLNVDERWLAAAAACGREVVAVVKNTPAWATDGQPGIGVPRGLYLPIDDPGNVWANFMRRAAAFYADRGVSRFIIWNEPDIEAGTYGFEFAGTLDDYAQLLKIAALAARQGSPDVQIHIAGTTYWHDVNQNRRLYVDRLLERITQDPEAGAHGYYFDAVNLHIYFRTDTIPQIVGAFRDLLARYGMTGKQVWIAETNASPNLDPLWRVERPQWQITLEQQSAFLAQAAALGLASGADAIGVYKFYDWSIAPGEESFSLIRADRSRRPAFETWRMVIDQFGGVTAADALQTPYTDLVRLERADGQTIYAAWARTRAPVLLSIAATADAGYMVDQVGAIMNVRPVSGAYMLTLPAAVCHEHDGCPREVPVGGAVTLLVQPHGSAAIIEYTSAGTVPLHFETE
ncbi:MAG: glycosyl hydrolase [bacterium]|nr:glycosyl hydrolase [bacterium]